MLINPDGNLKKFIDELCTSKYRDRHTYICMCTYLPKIHVYIHTHLYRYQVEMYTYICAYTCVCERMWYLSIYI